MTQFLPTDDTFTDGADNLGVSRSLYARHKPFSVVDVTTGFGIHILSKWGDLVDAYRSAELSNGQAGFELGAGESPAPGVPWALWSANEATDAECEAFFAFKFLTQGAGDTAAQVMIGVCGRVQATVPTSGAAAGDEHLLNGDGYYFVHFHSVGQGHRLIVFRAEAGSITASVDVATDANPLVIRPDSFYPMRLNISTNGSQVELRCYRRVPAFPAGGGAPSFIWDLAISWDDDHVDRITTAGRWGFGAQAFFDAGAGVEYGVHINSFMLVDGTTLIVRDEFERQDRYGAYLVLGVLADGFSLMSAWTGDLHGVRVAVAKHFRHLTPNADAVDTPPDFSFSSGQRAGWYVSQRPASSPQQHRKIVVTIGDIAPTQLVAMAGIHLRGTWTPFPSAAPIASEYQGRDLADEGKGKIGYLARVVFDDTATPVWALELRHFRGVNVDQPALLIASADLTGFGLAVDVSFTMQLEVQNVDSNAAGAGAAVALTAKVNSTVVDMTPLVTGVFAIDDWIYDLRSNASLDGLAEGFFAWSEDDSLTIDRIKFDTWTEEALTVPPVIGEPDQPSVVIAPETDGVTGTLLVDVTFPLRVTKAFEVSRVELELGHVDLKARYSRNRRRWNVTSRVTDATERATLIAFLDAHEGSEIPFNWVVPDTGEAIIVHFTSPIVDRALLWDGIEAVTFGVEELFPQLVFNP